MTQNADGAGTSVSVAPLRMKQQGGDPYCRRPEVEALLGVLLGLPVHELVERARVEDTNDLRYLPSECVLYFVRRPHPGNNDDTLRALFEVLRRRVLRAVPVPARRLPGSTKLAEGAIDLDIREAVLHKFQMLLCQDRREYEERLDFYECQFNGALTRLRATSRRDVRRDASRYESLDSDTDPTEPSAEVESALARLRSPPIPGDSDFLFRSKLLRAISLLPADEQRVVELLLQKMPIDSKEEGVLTIAKVLDCAEKTVRNRRDRAFAKLRDALGEEEHA